MVPIDRPTPRELIEAVREFLLGEIAPGLEGQKAFHVQVAGNVLAMVERSLEHGEQMDTQELSRLRSLLSTEGGLVELNAELARRIRSGEMDEDRERVLEHLRETVNDKLKLANPRYLTKGVRGQISDPEG